MKDIVILSNHHSYTYNFRKEIIERLISDGYKITLVLPYGEKVELLKDMGCEYINLPLDRRGMNPFRDIKLLRGYYKILKKINPLAVLTYTIKPNIYGGLVSRLLSIPFFPNVTGLGSAVEKETMLQKLLVFMYRLSYKKADCIFFQNHDNKNFFINKDIKHKKSIVIPGSGVNLEKFPILPYPKDDKLEFLYISRIMKQKGIEEFISAAKHIKNKYPQTEFHIVGFCEEDYESELRELHKDRIVQYHGQQNDILPYLERTHCTVHPTFYPEGMSNVLLESAASGRPIITTNRTGCKEIVDDNLNGFIVKEQDHNDLINKIENFISLNYQKKKQMGIQGRIKVEKEFNRDIVVNSYSHEIAQVLGVN
ncbi:galacturonosyltransferase [Terribacillus halophilus]|uniref:Galacturonosyltransferase n=1 Tax=Terribacillus halophilus TaxID=361279 RepID=A0A1G6IKV7_9BACI|nr:glycosyltransferase family 4 protein [Terribacillus halophilus]SDC07040.1 galacturonosyltransferase [Terribacillus halophilus]